MQTGYSEVYDKQCRLAILRFMTSNADFTNHIDWETNACANSVTFFKEQSDPICIIRQSGVSFLKFAT